MASVDVRKLKDSAAELFKRSKFEKAAEVLEQLAQAEPKDMQHRLKLGDCYRKLEQPQKSIAQYDAAGRYYADQGQLIKAIAAVKVILEIDPRNAGAQKQLADMNERLRAPGRKASPSDASLRPSRSPPPTWSRRTKPTGSICNRRRSPGRSRGP